MNKAPAFQFYAADFIVGTATMTAEEVGVYMRLLCYQWVNESLPDDQRALSLLAGIRRRVSSVVLAKFTKGEDGNLRNGRLEAERQKQAEFRESRSANARKRWGSSTSTGDARASDVNDSSTCETHALQSSSSSSSSAASPLPSSSSKKRASEQQLDPLEFAGLSEEQALDRLQNSFPDCDVLGEHHRLQKLAAEEGSKVTYGRLIAWLKKATPVVKLGSKKPTKGYAKALPADADWRAFQRECYPDAKDPGPAKDAPASLIAEFSVWKQAQLRGEAA